MKLLKKISFITCVTLTLFLSVFALPRISFAVQDNVKDCAGSCADKKQVCFNMNPDTRLCEAEYQDCIKSCNVNDSTSSSEQEKKLKKADPPK
jgi:hypothetical protein